MFFYYLSISLGFKGTGLPFSKTALYFRRNSFLFAKLFLNFLKVYKLKEFLVLFVVKQGNVSKPSNIVLPWLFSHIRKKMQKNYCTSKNLVLWVLLVLKEPFSVYLSNNIDFAYEFSENFLINILGGANLQRINLHWIYPHNSSNFISIIFKHNIFPPLLPIFISHWFDIFQ